LERSAAYSGARHFLTLPIRYTAGDTGIRATGPPDRGVAPATWRGVTRLQVGQHDPDDVERPKQERVKHKAQDHRRLLHAAR